MFQIDNSTAIAAIPAPTAAGSAGYFTDGNPATGVSATILPAEFMNMLMMENLNVLAAGGITPAKGQYNQLSLAIAKIVQSGAAGAASEMTAGILKLSTSTQVSAGTDDSTAVTPLKLLQKLTSYLVQATEGAFGWLKIATQTIVSAGMDDTAAVTPKKLATAIQAQAFTAFSTSGGAGALTLSPVPAIPGYAVPLRFRVMFSQNSTGSDTINVSGRGAKSIKQYGPTGVKVAAAFAANQLSDVEYDGTDFVLIDQLPASSGLIGSATGVSAKVATASSSLTIAASQVVVGLSLGGQNYNLSNFSATINLATIGAGGMDTGTAPVNGYVGLYAIYNPSTGATALLGVNASAAFMPAVYAGSNLPAGYTASALISVAPTNASGQFKICLILGRTVYIQLASAYTGTTSVTLLPVSISGAIPINAISIFGELSGLSSASTTMTFSVVPDTTQVAQQNLSTTLNAGSGMINNYANIPISTPQTVYVTTSTTAGTLTSTMYVGGYTI